MTGAVTDPLRARKAELRKQVIAARDALPATERAPLERACNRALRQTIELLRPRVVVGIGHFAEARAREALAGLDVPIGRIPHPSPASPAANRDWAGQAARAFAALGVDV